MSESNDLQHVIDILLQHYLHVGSDGYPAETYQDNYLEGLGDGVELVNQAIQLYVKDKDAFINQYLAHQFNSNKTLSLKPIPIYTMLGTYRPDLRLTTPPVTAYLVVHVPDLKFSHCYQLKDAGSLSDLDHPKDHHAFGEGVKYHFAIAESFSEQFDSDNQHFDNYDIEAHDFLKQRGQMYTNEYQFDIDHLTTLQTSEATVDLTVNKLLAQALAAEQP